MKSEESRVKSQESRVKSQESKVKIRIKEYNFVKKLGTKLCENYGNKVFWKIVLKNWLEELGGKIGCKEWLKNVVEDCVKKSGWQD